MKKLVIAIASSMACLLVGSAATKAQNFPSRPITVLLSSTPGTASDIIMRAMAPTMSARLGVAVVVENRPGGNGLIAAQALLNAPPDGYTLLLANGAVLSDVFVKAPPFDVAKDFAPVAPVVTGVSGILVNANLPATTLPQLIAYAKANPGKLNGGSGFASTMLLTEAFKKAAGVDIVRIDYKGSPPTVAALVSNEVQVAIDNPLTYRQQITDGKVRLLAVIQQERNRILPDIPTIVEGGVATMDYMAILGLWAKAGAPKDAIAKASAALNEALNAPAFSERLTSLGLTAIGGSSDAMASLLTREIAFWREAAKVANFVPE